MEKEKYPLTVWINGQVPCVLWIDENDDPFIFFEKKWNDVLSYLTKMHRAVKNTLRNFLFRESRPLLPLSPLECKLAAEDAHCPVCGDGFSGEYHACSGCSTLYHHDCWEYMGKCSIYGCGTKHI